MNVQWYPGHMTKAKRQMQEDIKLIDLIIELVDARVPLSSRNPDIDELGKNKSRLILLNKSDLADERQNEAWKTYFQAKGFYVVKVDSRNGSGMKAINNVIQEVCKEKIERDRRRGIKNRPIRAMVVGIPNVGKSTFINTFAGRACACLLYTSINALLGTDLTPEEMLAYLAKVEPVSYTHLVQIKMKLKESARDMGLPKNQQGWGELDLERFMEL